MQVGKSTEPLLKLDPNYTLKNGADKGSPNCILTILIKRWCMTCWGSIQQADSVAT